MDKISLGKHIRQKRESIWGFFWIDKNEKQKIDGHRNKKEVNSDANLT